MRTMLSISRLTPHQAPLASTVFAAVLTTGIGLVGCGEAKVDPTIAKAVKTENKMEKAAEELAERRQAEREAKARAKRELQKRRNEEIEAAATAPEDAPSTLEDACEGVVTAYDEFMKRGSEKDVLKWHDGRRRKLGERRTRCIEQGNAQVAACEAHALSQSFPSLKEIERTEAARMVMQRCARKYGS